MKIKIKNWWKISLLISFVLVGLLEAKIAYGGQECTEADYNNNPTACESCSDIFSNHTAVGANGELKPSGEKLYCNKSDGFACAFVEYTQISAPAIYAYCLPFSRSNNNYCLLGSGGNCIQCKEGFIKYGLVGVPIVEKPTLPAYYSAQRTIGCEHPAFCVKLEDEFYRKDTFTCATEADACGGGKGVYEKKRGEEYPPRFCLNPEQPCSPVIERELPSFVATEDFNVTNIDGGIISIKKGERAYCANEMNTVDPKQCFLEKDVYAGTGKDDFYIEKKYPPDQQDLIKNNFKPLYECKKGSLAGRVLGGILNNTIGPLITFVFGIIVTIVCTVLQVLLGILSAFLQWVIGFSRIDFAIVDMVWEFLRDFANMFFIIILLYIAFCTVLGIQSQSFKKLLPGFFAGVILVNFSKLICQIVIDFSQLLSDAFYNLNPHKTALIAAVMKAAGLNVLFGVESLAGSTSFTDFASVVGVQILMILYMLMATLVFGTLALLLALRIVILLIMTAVSPLIYVAMALGKGNIIKSYWSTFLRTAFFAPVMIFCLTFSVIVLSLDFDKYFASRSGTLENLVSEQEVLKEMPAKGASPQIFMKFVFAMVFMVSGMAVARKASIVGSAGILAGADKLFKMTAGWATGAKPAAAGIKALGRYGWERALRSPYLGKKLKWLSPKVWKEARKRARERAAMEVYGPRVAELQPRISGWRSFFHAKGPAYERAKFFAEGQYLRDVKKFADSIRATERPTEDIYGIFVDRKLDRAKDKGYLGTEDVLDTEMLGAKLVITERGDNNDELKTSKYGMEIAGGRAVMGADAKYLKRTAGGGPRVVQLANMISEASKVKYLQFVYSAIRDELTNTELETVDDDPELRKIALGPEEKPKDDLVFLQDTTVFQKYQQEKAKKLKVSFSELSDMMEEHLGQTRERILAKDFEGNYMPEFRDVRKNVLEDIRRRKKEGRISDELDEEVLLKGIASVVETYNKTRNALIASEEGKKSPQGKGREHLGSWLQDVNRALMTDAEREKYKDAPAMVKYLGIAPSAEAPISQMTYEDAATIGSWSEPRKIAAVRYYKNQDDTIRLARQIDAENRAKGKISNKEEIVRYMFELAGRDEPGRSIPSQRGRGPQRRPPTAPEQAAAEQAAAEEAAPPPEEST